MTKPQVLLRRKLRAPLSRSEQMSRIRSENTRPELVVRSIAHSLGLRFRLHAKDLPGKPDVVNRRARWAIFVHGCFWHSHEGCSLASKPRSNQAYWSEKLERNRERDEASLHALTEAGFRVLTVWECQTRDGQTARTEMSAFFKAIAKEKHTR